MLGIHISSANPVAYVVLGSMVGSILWAFYCIFVQNIRCLVDLCEAQQKIMAYY